MQHINAIAPALPARLGLYLSVLPVLPAAACQPPA